MKRAAPVLLVIVIVAVAVTVIVLRLAAPTGEAAVDAAAIELNNHGVGLMGRYDYDEAVVIFEELVRNREGWHDVRVNLAIAVLNRQAEGDEPRALDMLRAVIAEAPEHERARYCAGLLLYRLGAPEALEHLEFVVDRAATDPYAAYYYGSALESAGRSDEALTWYERVMGMDPYLRSAYWRAGQLSLRAGRDARGRELIDRFTRLEKNPRARTVDFIYGRMGPLAEAIAVDLAAASPAPRPEGTVFAAGVPLDVLDMGAAWSRPREDGPVSMTACDIDGNGRTDVFIAGALAGGNAILLAGDDGGFALDADHALAAVTDVNAVLWGNYDNDDLVDAYLCRRGPNQLWRQSPAGVWTDVTDTTGTANGGFDTVDGAFIDADHDIDLDIFCVNADGPNELLGNNLDGTFRPLAATQGLAGDGRASRHVVTGDLDGDRDADLLVVNDEPPHELYLNDRLWSYHVPEGAAELLNASIVAAVAGDVEGLDDGVELYTLDEAGRFSRWTLEAGRYTPSHDDRLLGGHRLALADVTGDGAMELLVAGPAGWAAYAPGARSDPPIASAARPLWGWTMILAEPGRGPAIAGLTENGPVMWAAGPGRHEFAALRLTGKSDPAGGPPPMRTNASGIGARVAVRAGTTWTVLTTFRSDSGPGQGLQPLSVGLAGQPHLDFVAIDWPDGVFQSEVHGVPALPDAPPRDLGPAGRAGRVEVIEEIQRVKSSCPVIFVWDGTRYRFVTDVLGVGGIGFMTAPGEYGAPRPWERLLLPHGLPAARAGVLAIKIGEPMEEACYLDAARLIAYDLPPAWSMTIDERFAISGPEPTGEPWFYRRSLAPATAVNDRGEDVFASILAADGAAAPVGPHDERFIGRLARDHVLTLEFDEPIDGRAGRSGGGAGPILVIDGWIEYPYSQTMFAAWQAGAEYRAPTLEARGDDGAWHVVLEQFGYPAGMPRQMSVELPELPAGTTELRLATNQEIYWDRILVAWPEPCPEAIRRELALRTARLDRVGFAARVPRPQRRPDYDYERRTPLWDTRHQAGFYTKFGPVDELVGRRDDALAIFGPGEEVHLEWAEPARPAPPGWTRRFVLETEGWCKDMDLFTRQGETIAPMPASAAGPSSADVEALHRRYQTRYESGR